VAEKKYILIASSKAHRSTPYASGSHHDRQEFQEAIVIKAVLLTDVLAKAAYALLAITAFVFISMVLLPALH